MNKQQDDYHFVQEYDNNKNTKPQIIQIPVFSLGYSERQSLINFVHQNNIKFDNEFLEPYVSCFEISCRWESQCFMLCIFLYFLIK